MGRPVSSAQLQIRVDRAKRREAAMLAKKTSTPPKPYAKRPPTTTVLANQVGSEKVFVRIPVPTSTLGKLPDGLKIALGMKAANSTLAALGSGSSIVDFVGNHKKVLRVSVYPGLATPQEKNTSWGTRVVKMIDKSFSFPVGGENVTAVTAAFLTEFGKPEAKALMGAVGSAGYAVLRLGRTVLAKVTA